MTLRAVTYARFSSDLQSAASIDDQERVCRQRAVREGWLIIDTYADHAISGSTMQRPGYQALMARLHRGGIDIVLTESWDRISRDPEHTAGFFKRATFAGARIITLAEDEITDFHVGLKGAMGAIYLKDLRAKTHRGQEGRILAGRSIGGPPYGYQVVRQIGRDGDLDRGLRAIDEAEAAVVRRIFDLYVRGASPLRIARTLNADGVPGPSGGPWLEDTIRGRSTRGDGILRNAIYDGRLVWNRRHNLKDPVTGALVRRAAATNTHVEVEVPLLKIVERDQWQAAQARLLDNAAAANPAAPDGQPGFWDRRKPRHLLTGKVFCGICGQGFATMGKDYLRCMHARNGHCANTASLRRGPLESAVLDALRVQLMAPHLLKAFVGAFTDEWQRLAQEARVTTTASTRERAELERKIANLIEVLSEDPRSPGIRIKLADLEAQLDRLPLPTTPAVSDAPRLPTDLGAVYRSRLAEFELALTDIAMPDLLEAARALIERVVVHPPAGDDGLPKIELDGNLPRMLQLAINQNTKKGDTESAALFVNAIECSVKRDPGAKPLAFLPCRHPTHA